MGRRHAAALALVGLLIALVWLVLGRGLDPERRPVSVDSDGPDAVEGAVGTGVVGGPVAPAGPDRSAAPGATVREDVVYTPEDVRIFGETMAWARDQQLAQEPLGEIMVRVGQRFVGKPYTPHTLDVGGPERVIVNLREFDCVTYVESVLALARMIQAGDTAFAALPEELRRIRYRDGELDGYPSRLHYFTEWIADNENKGLVRDITADLGGVSYDEPIDFMSSNAEAYPQLDGFPDRIERIREIEETLSRRARTRIPENAIAEVADQLRNGDIIAATSDIRGLDVAHTGLALWQDGALHLMHAPLVGRSTEISEQPLAVRIVRIDGQDGMIVARPL